MACPNVGGESAFVRDWTPRLIRCVSASSCRDNDQDCTVITFDLVRVASGETNNGDQRIECEGIHFTELPEDYCPSGPLELTEYPNGGSVALVARHYSVAERFRGAALLFVTLRDSNFDAQTLVGRVFSIAETTGAGGIQPLFQNL